MFECEAARVILYAIRLGKRGSPLNTSYEVAGYERMIRLEDLQRKYLRIKRIAWGATTTCLFKASLPGHYGITHIREDFIRLNSYNSNSFQSRTESMSRQGDMAEW